MNKIIKQDNSITNARYDYSACQQDLVFIVMGQIHDDDNSSKQYQISVSDIEQQTGRAWNYQQLKEATEGILGKVYQMENEVEYTQFVVFQEFRYVKGTGVIQARLTEIGLLLYKNLKGNFTTYELKSALSMTSKYAKRIYQICSQWKDIGESKKIEIFELKKNLGLIDEKGNEQCKQIVDLKNKVLNIAIKQINEHTDLEVSYILEGEFRKKKPLKYVTFYIKKKSLLMLPIEFENEANPDVKMANLQVVLNELGIKVAKVVQQIMADDEMIKEVFSFNYKLKTGQIKANTNAGGLLLKKLGLR